jgi:CRISPR-associated protein Cas2
MFVAVACDLGSEDHQRRVQTSLAEYGFKKVHEGLYESLTINEPGLLRLKRELDRLTDSYDTLRFYQYPMDSTLVISVLKEKKWRKTVVNTNKREHP